MEFVCHSHSRITALNVFLAGAAELQGLTASEIAKKLAIPEAKGGFRLIEFPSTSITGIATPINRANPRFITGGKTARGASEYVIPNGPIPPSATQRIVK